MFFTATVLSQNTQAHAHSKLLLVIRPMHAAKHTSLVFRKYPWNARYPWQIRELGERLTARKVSTCSNVCLLHVGSQTMPAVSLLGYLTDRKVLHEGRKSHSDHFPSPSSHCSDCVKWPKVPHSCINNLLQGHRDEIPYSGLSYHLLSLKAPRTTHLHSISLMMFIIFMLSFLLSGSGSHRDKQPAVDEQDLAPVLWCCFSLFSLPGTLTIYCSCFTRAWEPKPSCSYILPCFSTDLPTPSYNLELLQPL